MKVIGLTGFAKSGKSTAAEVLKELGGKEVAFAKHLKDVCSLVFGVPRSHFDDQNKKEVEFNHPHLLHNDQAIEILEYFEVAKSLQPDAIIKHAGKYLHSPRQIAQYIGTELLRGVDVNIHVNMAFKLNNGNKARFLVCSDVRFQNEMESVHKVGGIVLGINRKSAMPKNILQLHQSEAEIPALIFQSDMIILNESSVEDFKAEIAMTVENYLK
jgi:hypothetical protein